ncbi:putative ATP-dependent RNA helicase DHX58 isoform 2 [Planoprotostelium fungivorum]|uniref:Putative ATP-dependent RNA helicase DHX58 isoform 2 n=1 Tax=Planoprotostelium fungivorum TaxID=1890364 RepID=A0A2P6N9I8_9EUKA|nr:putative ATP-dependent RNA helicase DHX58 isoform 2 [Planoprotostelium fungivorum]
MEDPSEIQDRFREISLSFVKEKGLQTKMEESNEENREVLYVWKNDDEQPGPKYEFTKRLFNFFVDVKEKQLQSVLVELKRVGQIQMFDQVSTESVSSSPHVVFSNGVYTLYRLYGETGKKALYDWFFLLTGPKIDRISKTSPDIKDSFGLKHFWDKDKKPRKMNKSQKANNPSGEASTETISVDQSGVHSGPDLETFDDDRAEEDDPMDTVTYFGTLLDQSEIPTNPNKRPRGEMFDGTTHFGSEEPFLCEYDDAKRDFDLALVSLIDENTTILMEMKEEVEQLTQKVKDMSAGDHTFSQYSVRRKPVEPDRWYLRCEGEKSGSENLCHAKICGADEVCIIYVSKSAPTLMLKSGNMAGMIKEDEKINCSQCNTNIGELMYEITEKFSFANDETKEVVHWDADSSKKSFLFLGEEIRYFILLCLTEERDLDVKDTAINRDKTLAFLIRLFSRKRFVEHKVYLKDPSLSFGQLKQAAIDCFPQEDHEFIQVMWKDKENPVTEQTKISRVLAKSDNKLIISFHCREELKLYPDQIDMIERSTDINSIIVSPTGSGKTVIALARCIEAHKRQPQGFKAVFVVDKVHLATQQAKLFSVYSDLKIITITAEDSHNETWDGCLSSDVIVIIADKFMDMVQQPAIWSDISLLSYRSVPADGKRPVVLGMTASPGGAISNSSTLRIIHLLQWSLGGAKIVKATGEMEQLQRERVNEPEILEVSIEMTDEQKEIYHRSRLEKPDRLNGLERGSESYMEVLDKIQKEGDPSLKELREIAENLAILLDTGDLSENGVREGDPAQDGWNRKFEILKSLLERDFETEDTDSYRAVVFVTTKRSVTKWYNMLRDSKIHFNYGHVMGQNTSGSTTGLEGVGMTRRQQKENLDKFKNGALNVLVATNVIEEGLDVPQCNVVFYCGDLTSHRSFIQARGRARKKGSKFYVIYVKGHAFFERSQIQEESMRRVLNQLYENGNDGRLPEDYNQMERCEGSTPPNPMERTEGSALLNLDGIAQFLSEEKEKGKDPISLLKETVDKFKCPQFIDQYSGGRDEWRADVEFLDVKAHAHAAKKAAALKEAARHLIDILIIKKNQRI